MRHVLERHPNVTNMGGMALCSAGHGLTRTARLRKSHLMGHICAVIGLECDLQRGVNTCIIRV